MYVLIRIDDENVLAKVLNYFKKSKILHRLFRERIYDVKVTAEDRIERIKESNLSVYLNPPSAWNTCASFVQAWDWDGGGNADHPGRGPYPHDEFRLKRSGNSAPRGKGWKIINGRRIRVAGECACPENLSFITCRCWCPYYEPTNIESWTYLARQVREELLERANTLERQIKELRDLDISFEEAVREGLVWRYKNGEFIITDPFDNGRS